MSISFALEPAALQTADDVVTPAGQYSLSPDALSFVRVHAKLRDINTGEGGKWACEYIFSRQGVADAVKRGSGSKTYDGDTGSTIDLVAAADGFRIDVQGKAGVTYNWIISGDVEAVS